MRFLLPLGGTTHANQQLVLIGREMEAHVLRLGLIRQDDWCGLSAETMRVFRGKRGRHQEQTVRAAACCEGEQPGLQVQSWMRPQRRCALTNSLRASHRPRDEIRGRRRGHSYCSPVPCSVRDAPGAAGRYGRIACTFWGSASPLSGASYGTISGANV